VSGARHLYVHLPFCAHRCGYCDFVTAVGKVGEHGRYVEAVLAELELERRLLASELETIFVGGGTPTFTEQHAFERLLAALPDAEEVTVEANPETVTPELAALLSRNRVNRVSIGAQSFRPALLDVLERAAMPDDVRRAVHVVRDAGFENVSLDLIYGIPGQSASDLERDLDEALALKALTGPPPQTHARVVQGRQLRGWHDAERAPPAAPLRRADQTGKLEKELLRRTTVTRWLLELDVEFLLKRLDIELRLEVAGRHEPTRFDVASRRNGLCDVLSPLLGWEHTRVHVLVRTHLVSLGRSSISASYAETARAGDTSRHASSSSSASSSGSTSASRTSTNGQSS